MINNEQAQCSASARSARMAAGPCQAPRGAIDPYPPIREMERIQKLNQKQSLNASDAAFILQFIQEQTAPLLSLHSSYNSPSTAAEHELNGQHSGSCGRHKVVHKKQHAHRSGCGGTSRNDGQSLDFASLNEFPPVSMSLQETNR